MCSELASALEFTCRLQINSERLLEEFILRSNGCTARKSDVMTQLGQWPIGDLCDRERPRLYKGTQPLQATDVTHLITAIRNGGRPTSV
jgi:hypothetical protein